MQVNPATMNEIPNPKLMSKRINAKPITERYPTVLQMSPIRSTLFDCFEFNLPAYLRAYEWITKYTPWNGIVIAKMYSAIILNVGALFGSMDEPNNPI